MKAGSKVHKKLEDEVHTTVKVDVLTREDAFGLKIWNFIQGLRTLRETGLTREQEVWGMVDGHLVTGIIDGLSHTSPDPKLEAELAGKKLDAKGKPTEAVANKDIREMLGQTPTAPKIYLCDVKTRGSARPPSGAPLFRPAKVQLFLYHRFLSDMAANKLDFFRVLKRLNLDPDEPFTDDFLAQISSLHDEVFDSHPSTQESYVTAPSSTQDSTEDSSTQESNQGALNYRTVRELLPLMKVELAKTFPLGADSLGRLLTVDYRFRGDGSIIGTKVFCMDDQELDQHLAKDLQWWKGEREPRGVDVEEAFKCRICEFADDCSWRKGLDEENLRRAKEKMDGKMNKETPEGK
jgi:exonuclease V